jgi:glycosyltransferase involved in cell wall biosynthesis
VLNRSRLLLSSEIPFKHGGLRTSGFDRNWVVGIPKVSILIASLNNSTHLEETLLSILSQNYENIEIIIVDGDSIDGTDLLLKKYNEKIDYWVMQRDSGISDAFNKGALLSSGDFLNFQGCGDLLVEPNVITKAMEGINKDSDMLVSCRVRRVDVYQPTNVLWESDNFKTSYFDKKTLLFKMTIPHQGLFTNWMYFEKYGLFDLSLKYSMDYENLLRSYENFPTIVVKNLILSSWRSGGVGTGKIYEILKEYNFIRIKNNVANIFLLYLIYFYSIFKFILKKILNIDRL